MARVLSRFSEIRDRCLEDNRGPNLDDVLQHYHGARYDIRLRIRGKSVQYSFAEVDRNDILQSPLYEDELSGLSYFFGKFPIEYLFHDNRINPRSIGTNVGMLVEEFFKKRPQLHISLGYVALNGGELGRIRLFDGQHKAAAQVMLGVRELPARVFVNPDPEVLLTTNTNAGTILRQVAFDKSVQRHLGSALFRDRVERYRQDLHLPDSTLSFSENDLVKHFKGETKEMRRYVIDSVRDTVTHDRQNKLVDFVDFGGHRKEKPLSYNTIDRTFYSFFIYQGLLDTPLDYRLEEGENPREREKEQILRLMSTIAEEIYIGKFDFTIGTHRIENRVQKGDIIPEDHLASYRLSREELVYTWLRYVQQIIENYFIILGKPIQKERLFQYAFPEPLWERIRTFGRNLRQMPVWVNTELSLSVFGGKQNYDYWQTVFETGRTPQNQEILAAPINLMDMIKD